MSNKCFYSLLFFFAFSVVSPSKAQMLEGCNQIYNIERTIASCTVMIEDAGSTEPDLITALINRAIAYERDGEFSLALHDYNQAEVLSPDDYRIYFNRPFVYGAQFRIEEQLSDRERLVELLPNSAAALAMRGSTLSLLGDFERALDDLDRAIELDPTYPLAYVTRSVVQSALGDRVSSVDDLARFLELNPEDVFGDFLSICRPGHSASALLITIDRLNDAPNEVTPLQRYLVDTGYYTGTPSGVFDDRTEQALEGWLSVNCPRLID